MDSSGGLNKIHPAAARPVVSAVECHDRGRKDDGVFSAVPPSSPSSCFKIYCEGQVLFMLLVIQKGSRRLEQVARGNEWAVYVRREEEEKKEEER